MQKKRNAIMAILSILLAAALSVGGTLAYMTDSQTLVNKFTVGDLDIAFDEPNYPGDCNEERVPGDSYAKDPTVEAIKGDAYIRIKVEFQPLNGSTSLSAARVAKILKTIYYDRNFSKIKNADGYIGSDALRVWDWVEGSGNHHTPSDKWHYWLDTDGGLVRKDGTKTNVGDTLQIQNWFNHDEFELETTSDSGVFYLNYKGILAESQKATIFTSIVFPSNWNQNDLKELGNYQIKLTAQAIQAAGFADRAEAYAALDKEVAGVEGRTLLVNYGETKLTP